MVYILSIPPRQLRRVQIGASRVNILRVSDQFSSYVPLCQSHRYLNRMPHDAMEV
jgi:hypothetical protein